MEFTPGQKVADYEVLAKLGAGGLGAVYEVRHLISERHEAMKIMLANHSGSPEMVERFRREVQTLAALHHVNIAALHTAFYHEDQLAMIIELVQGETLRSYCLGHSITLAQSLDFVSQILQALVYAHGLGVVHRDIKPQNIMVTPEKVVKLLDFGIAITDRSSDLTQPGHLLGSISYISPEQVNGGKATPQSDIYSLGVVLYELLTGRLPITGSNSYEILLGHAQKVPEPACTVNPRIPGELSAIAARALAKDPAQRFVSAEEFLRALRTEISAQSRSTEIVLPPTQSIAMPFHPSTGSGRSRQQPSQTGSQTVPLDEITRKLAVYIGPVAKFVVRKLAAQFEDTDSIYREAAKQITSETDRAAFLRSKHH